MQVHSKVPAAPVALVLAWVTLALPPLAAAQTVQKCIAADGHVTLTSDACGAGERLEASYQAVPEPATAVVAARSGARGPAGAREAAPRASARGAAPRQRVTSAKRTRRAPDRCQAARDRRERTLARVGLKRTFDLLRRLDDEVWAACR